MPKKRQQLLLSVVFLLSYGIFLKGLSPSVFLGDNGDFLGAAVTLGISHPTGYPTFLLINKLFSFLRLGEIAFRLTLFSASMGGLTLVTSFLLVKTLFNKWQVALWSTLILTGCSTLFSQSVIFEVYTFNAWLLVLTLLAAIISVKNDNKAYLLIALFFLGMGITNHLLMVLIIPPLVSLYYLSKTRLSHSKLLKVIMLLILVYGLNLYLPLRSYNLPQHHWTEIAKFKPLLEQLNGAQYRHRMFGLTLKQYQENLRIVFELYFTEFSPFLLLFFFIGLYYLKDLELKYLIFFGLIVFINFLYNLNYYIPHEIKVYYLPASIIFAFIIALGIEKISHYVSNRFLRTMFCLLLTALPLWYNFAKEAHRTHFYAYDIGENILRILPEQAVFFVESDDQLMSLSYQINALGKRPDLRVINRVGTLFEDFYSFRRDKSMRERVIRQTKEAYFIQNTYGKQAIFTGVKIELPKGFILQPRAYIYEIVSEATPKQHSAWRYLQMRKKKRQLSHFNDQL